MDEEDEDLSEKSRVDQEGKSGQEGGKVDLEGAKWIVSRKRGWGGGKTIWESKINEEEITGQGGEQLDGKMVRVDGKR